MASGATLKAGRIFLRPLRDTDTPALYPLLSDPSTMLYWAYSPVTSMEEARARVAANMGPEDKVRTFVVVEAPDGTAQGWVTLYGIENRMAGAGYIIAPALRGRGLVSEAVTGLLDHAFGAMDLHRVYLDIDPENSPSIRLAQRLGFRWEGHFRQSFFKDGLYYDSVFYAMLAAEWRAQRAGSA
ncbi:MAG TPA: GNAT family N-acetyltransferase [Alphaproteobacteria bacterium]|nr:GNAT family N-acetyltransferase [Alphaproteobacteria bacterium]HAJ46331.1 GNAT family N-acetyltransferase [Alphaproteobacteria bacterium]